MKYCAIILTALLGSSLLPVQATEKGFTTSVQEFTEENDSSLVVFKKRPWRAGIQTFGLNVGVWAFDRYVMNEDFAKISWSSVKHNVRNGFVWDNDQLSTNLFAHPYHGGLYFNAARCNGMSFWESVPYTFVGSLMWELTCEIEPPAINDLIATTIGGVALGEVTHRMSALVLDDTQRGANRVLREFVGTLICPIRGLNRMITGDMWRVRSKRRNYYDRNKTPVHFTVGTGVRYLADDNYFARGEYNPYIDLRLQYGDAFQASKTPFNNFSFRSTFGLTGNQPLITDFSLNSNIWSTYVDSHSGVDIVVGLFQHFNYFDSEEVVDGTGRIPYKLAEAASIGPGILYRFPKVNQLENLEQRIYLSGILLGGSLTDYYNVIDRNYNMGSGYSIKSNTLLDFGRWGLFSLNLQHFRIFTWKGYSEEELIEKDPLYLNSQGDKGNVSFTLINSMINVGLTHNLKLNFETTYYLRHTHYHYHKDVTSNTFDARLGLVYKL